MFSSVGWGEILIIVVVGIIVVGPERLPRLITDVKALLLAARNAIADARKELDQDFGEDFEEFRKPLSQLNSVRQMGARGFITKTLLDDDDSFLTDLESSAKDVTGAIRGTGARVSGQAPKNPPRPTEVPADPAVEAAAAPETDTAPAASGDEPRVELPQQDEVGQSRDWGRSENYDDTM
ncbi:Sec-independent protein translocase protein TatB [Corynebacterium sp. AOP40-9SA-29]|uniref:Sec-independent protein translocase protein TatB n=1 Tax=Corynebacterium sp. AOP40-9SA-29 TaxID=3457677 RepID=UPI004034B7FF